MSKKPGSNLIHIYHLLGKDDEYSCRVLLNIIKDKCGRLADVKTFILMCLFDALVGNHDRHGRNIGLVQNAPSSFALSPTYDNPSYIGIEAPFLLGADLNPKGKIRTSKTNEPTLKDYLNEFNILEYNEITDDFIKKVKLKWSEILSIVHDSDLTTPRRDALLTLLQKRFKEI